jgi:hypothetical protein
MIRDNRIFSRNFAVFFDQGKRRKITNPKKKGKVCLNFVVDGLFCSVI